MREQIKKNIIKNHHLLFDFQTPTRTQTLVHRKSETRNALSLDLRILLDNI